jgi:large subunit ribosomal protein L24
MRKLTYRATKRATARQRSRHAKNAERMVLPVGKGDTVRVLRGDDKGKEGTILRVNLKTGRVVVDGVNMVKRHRKARSAEETSGIIDFPAAIHHSNVMLLDPKGGTPTRVRARVDEDGTKERVSAKSGDAIPRVVSRKR